MVPSFLETGARVLVIRFFKGFIGTGCLILMDEGSEILTFEGVKKMSPLKVILRVRKPQFYWKVATGADLGFADSYIDGDISFVDENKGLLNFLMVRTFPLVVAHGGCWKENIYEGGRKEYIPIPPSGISFESLLAKLEVRMKKDKRMYMFDTDGLVKSPSGETMRMKITDEFELSYLMDVLEFPTVYVAVSPTIDESHNRRTPLIDDGVRNEDQNSFDVGCDELGLDGIGENDDHDVGNSNVDGKSDVGNESSVGQRLWVIPGAAHQASLPSDEILVPVVRVDEFVQGGTFVGKKKLKAALGLYHMKKHLECKTIRSNKVYYHVGCKLLERCEFEMRASASSNLWRINLFTRHSCVDDLRYHPDPKVSSRVVATHLGPNFGEDGSCLRPKDIQSQIRREFGVNVKYSTALAGKHHALELSFGDVDNSFQMIPKFLYMLEQMNPGSIVDLQTCPDGLFQYCYFALSACIRAFRACRPVIVIDGTHLKGKYKGILFVAATKDANEQIVPLAFGIGDVEDTSSWSWFLERVRRTFGCPQDFMIVSDQHLSIKNAIDGVYPGIPHGLCTFHIQGNLKTWGTVVIDLFHLAANAYRVEDYEEYMNNLKEASPGGYEKLMSIGPSRWSVALCPVRKFGFGTSNAVENMNSRLRWARKLPACSLLEYCRNLVQSWFFQRRTKSGSRNEELSVYATKELGIAVEAGRVMRVEPISDTKFNVICGVKSNVVDVASRKCSCRAWDLDLIPCSHATAAIRFKKESPLSYVHEYYSTATWREIYADDVMPIPDKDSWSVPPHVASRIVLTPKEPKQAGRPRTKRIPTGSHTKRNRGCLWCHEKGHYMSTCPLRHRLINPEKEGSSNQPSINTRTRKTKKCGICGVAGHTRQTCQDPHRFG